MEQAPEGEAVDLSPFLSEPQPQLAAIPTQDNLETDAGIEVVERIEKSREPLDSENAPRRYAFLFTRLRNRRRDLAARTGR